MSCRLVDPPPVFQCEHYTCRCAQAEEFSLLADAMDANHGLTSLSIRLRQMAVHVHEQRVRCRLPLQVS
jgi:hypothetical protein